MVDNYKNNESEFSCSNCERKYEKILLAVKKKENSDKYLLYVDEFDNYFKVQRNEVESGSLELISKEEEKYFDKRKVRNVNEYSKMNFQKV